MKSIFQKDKECYVCHSTLNLHYHHIYFGNPLRKISDKHGFTCYLCYDHHEGTYGVHGKYGDKLDLELKQGCQRKYEETHTRENFIRVIGRNYL